MLPNDVPHRAINQSSEIKYNEGDIQYFFAVLDCILEKHFKSLKVFVPSPVLKSFSALMAIIICRFPMLVELQVSFQKRKRKTISPKLYKTISPGSLLPYLKKLTLSCNHESLDTNFPDLSNFRSLLTTKEKLCLVLTKLDIQGAAFKKNIDILALIEKAEWLISFSIRLCWKPLKPRFCFLQFASSNPFP